MARFYANPVHKILEESLAKSSEADGGGDSVMMEVSNTFDTSGVDMQVSGLPPTALAEVPVAVTMKPHSVGFRTDDTICNTTTVDASVLRARGSPEPSILQEGSEFSRLEGLDATLTDRQTGETSKFKIFFKKINLLLITNVCLCFRYLLSGGNEEVGTAAQRCSC